MEQYMNRSIKGACGAFSGLLFGAAFAASALPAGAQAAAPVKLTSTVAGIVMPAGVTLQTSAGIHDRAIQLLQKYASAKGEQIGDVEVFGWRGGKYNSAAVAPLKAAVVAKLKLAGYTYALANTMQGKVTKFTFFRATRPAGSIAGLWIESDNSFGLALGSLTAGAPADPAPAPAADPNDPLAPLTSTVTGVVLPRAGVRSTDAALIAAITTQLQKLSESGGLKVTCQPAESLEWKGATMTVEGQAATQAGIVKALSDGGWTYRKVGGDTRPNGVTRTFFLAKNGTRQVLGILRTAKQTLEVDWSEMKPAE
jgi:hypothetical protein